MEESKAVDVPIETNPEQMPSTSSKRTIEQTHMDDAAIEGANKSTQVVRLATTEPPKKVVRVRHFLCPIYETYEINHDHYRFAYDLVETVLEIRRELKPDVNHNLPEPQTYLLTEEHKNMVKSLLHTWNHDPTNLIREIYPLTNGVYDYGSYVKCRDNFAGYWQAKEYSEKCFISACAMMANVAAHFIQKNSKCGALDDVVEYIANWVGIILGNGTFDESHW